jgi:hypothetical protein
LFNILAPWGVVKRLGRTRGQGNISKGKAGAPHVHRDFENSRCISLILEGNAPVFNCVMPSGISMIRKECSPEISPLANVEQDRRES